MTDPSSAVEFTDVSRHFDEVRAVERVSFRIPDGEFFTLLGPSGSGKTTCLRLIAGFDRPTSGHIQLFGRDVTKLPPYERDVNTVFQNYALFPHMTVGENIAYSGFPSTTPTDMFEQWRNSPGHNANMLLDRYVTAGMGFAVGPNYGTTGTQNFAVVDNGATDTAADMLTSGACDTAESAEVSAQARVDKAKRRVQGAKGKKRKRKARKKLQKAKARLKDAAAKADAACDLTY